MTSQITLQEKIEKAEKELDEFVQRANEEIKKFTEQSNVEITFRRGQIAAWKELLTDDVTIEE